MSEDRHYLQFAILRDIANNAVAGLDFNNMARSALESSAKLVGLSAVSIQLWNNDFEPVMTVAYAENESFSERLGRLEADLYLDLRKRRDLVSAYLSLGGDNPITSFTLPLKKKNEIYGAVIGIQSGLGSLVREDEFLSALSDGLSLSLIIARIDNVVEENQLRILRATSTAVNHEINNQLQAIVGTIQLMLKDAGDMDEKTVRKLQLIEESSNNITRITHRLMQLKEIKFTDYIDGTEMLDLSDEE